MSRDTNIKIGGRSPAAYVPAIQTSSGIEPHELDQILRGHAIDPGSLRAADFDTFFTARTKALLELIDAAMAKPAIRSEVIHAMDGDAPASFDIEPADTEPDIDFSEESAA